jgi:hypothetical protein
MSATPQPAPWKLRLLALALASVVVLTPACSRVRHKLFGGGTTTRNGTLTVAPPKGAVGTSFSLTASGFRPGEPMTFEVDPPNHKRFVGPSHTAGPDGKVVSVYTPQPGDPPGSYLVKATGSRGTRAQSHVDITAA